MLNIANPIRFSKKAAQILAVVGMTTAIANPASAAPSYTEWGSVKVLSAGWVQDTMSVTHSAPVVNPSGCSVTNAGYATNPEDPGHSLFHTMLMAAFLNRKEVQLLIEGCVYNKPRIIGVNVR
jgi:hypothetical protein